MAVILCRLQKQTRLPSNLRQTTRECVYSFSVVTSGRVTKMAIPYPKTPWYTQTSRLCVLYRAVFVLFDRCTASGRRLSRRRQSATTHVHSHDRRNAGRRNDPFPAHRRWQTDSSARSETVHGRRTGGRQYCFSGRASTAGATAHCGR